MSLLFTIRTADRYPKPNYLRDTLESLRAAGMPASAIHLLPTDPDTRWLTDQLPRGLDYFVHPPARHRKPNANALAQIDLLDQFPAEWIVMTEDDLEWCQYPLESLEAWLRVHACGAFRIYRFFTFGTLEPLTAHCGAAPLREQRGSQVVALRSSDAIRFAAWARAHPRHWRPPGAPFQDRHDDGFDKLLGYWALSEDPGQLRGLVSRPFFVRHLGKASAIHAYGVTRDELFAGRSWHYPPGGAR